ncbi:MAG: PKD domain-containing protein [Flavobacteriales bacterium]
MLRKLVLLLLFGLFAHLGAKATHISGGEIYYECISGNRYRITLVIYRDCIGIALNNSYNLALTSPCGNATLTVSTPGGVEISQLCNIALPNSTCRGGSLPGIQRYVYTGTITLPPCDSWTISWAEKYRNAAVANLVSPDDQATYIRAVMNTATGVCNGSPQFTNTAIPYVCAGYPVSYSYGAFDPDGDSLSYQLVGAMTNNGQALAYRPPYSALQPIPGITVDPVTGLVNFTLNQQGNWVVVVRVNEYRNGVLIGSVMRDMQFVAYPCSNIPPDPTTGTVSNLTGAAQQSGPRAIEVCESGNFCFDAVISDPDAANILTATTNITQNLPGATITYTGTNPLRAHVCWTASPGTSGFHPFIITVNDGACPIPALQTYVYAVQVRDGIRFNVSSTSESCGGTGDGTATATVTAGTAPYQYNWSNGAITQSITAGAGTYNVSVTDANGCVTAPATATITATRQPGVAHGGPDLVGCSDELPVQLRGNVTNAGGGQWYGGSGSYGGTGLNNTYMPTPQEVQAGRVELYFATTGTGACPPDVDTVQVVLPANFRNASITSTDATCADATNGTATYILSNPGLSYRWNDANAQATPTATGLASGGYTVRVTDTYGCDTVLPVIINAPAQLAIANINVAYEQCAGSNDGSISVNVTGGTAPYHYAWSNGDTTAVIHVGAGTYTVDVRDASGCTIPRATATVTALGQPNQADAGTDLIGCFSQLPVTLHGSVMNATGGTWSGGSGSFSGSGLTVDYMPSPAEIAAGGVDLYLSTTGNTTCPVAVDAVHVTLSNGFHTGRTIAHDANCFGATTGSAEFLPDVPGFTYHWNDASAQTTRIATGLGAGSYNVRVTDILGCDTTLNVPIASPAQLTVAGLAVVDEQCAGNNDGRITATVTGGTEPYTYSWSNGAGTPSITVGAGTYTLTVTDANGCSAAQASATVHALGQPNHANAGADLIGCFSRLPVSLTGSVVNATGGTWSGGAGSFSGTGLNVTYMPTTAEINAGGMDLFLTTTGNTTCAADRDTVHLALSHSFHGNSITATDANCFGATTGSAEFLPNAPGLTFLWNDATAQTTRIATGLGAGSYSVQVTDILGCDTTLNVTIASPAQLTVADLAVVDEQCAGNNDGRITATVTGGTGPYTYNWSNGASTPSITVGAGTYTLTVTDANGCSAAQASATVDALGQPNHANAGADLIGCFSRLPVSLNGSVVNATGGTWSGGAGSFAGAGLNVTYMPTTAEINAGGVDLFLTTTGNTTCAADRDTVHLALSHSFRNGSATATGVGCNGGNNGTASFLPNTPGFTYAWSDPATQHTRTATGLASGTYTVHVTDALGCDTTATVFVPQPAVLVASSVTVTPPTCPGGGNGTARVTVSGGTAPYQYQWSANASDQTGQTAIALAAGTYVVRVSDANGCTAEASGTLTSPPLMTLAAQVLDTVCVNAPVQLTAQASGGTGALSVHWAGIGDGDTLRYAFATSRNVVVSVSDANGCTGPALTLPVTVLDLRNATLHTGGDTTLCPGGSAVVRAWVTGYPRAVTLSWTEPGLTGTGPHTLPMMNASSTLHVVATDACGVTLNGQVQINVETPPVITLPPVIAEGCAPLTVHFPAVTDRTVRYLWDMGDGTTSTSAMPVHTYPEGDYTVSLTVTTPAGCVGRSTNGGQVIAYGMPVAAFTASTWQTGFTDGPVQFNDQSTGDISAYDWRFGDGASSDEPDPLHRFSEVGNLHVELTVTSPHGCVSTVSHPITIDPDYNIVIPNAFTPDPNSGGGGLYDPTALDNDVFYPFIRFVKDFNMRIYNRWGELVFESNDIRRGWDGYYRGHISQQDVYVYKMQVRFVDDKQVERMGDLTLFR